MNYLLLIHQGDTPLPGTEAWERVSADEQTAVYADYQAINQTPGVTPACGWTPLRWPRPSACRTATH
jgi:hypothetical protein